MFQSIQPEEAGVGDLAIVVYPTKTEAVYRDGKLVSHARLSGRYGAFIVDRGELTCRLQFHYEHKNAELLNFRSFAHSGWEEYWENGRAAVTITFHRWDGDGDPFEREHIDPSQRGDRWLSRILKARRTVLSKMIATKG